MCGHLQPEREVQAYSLSHCWDKTLAKATQGRAGLFWPSGPDMVYHAEKGKMSGARGSWWHCVHSQEADECWWSAGFFLSIESGLQFMG